MCHSLKKKIHVMCHWKKSVSSKFKSTFSSPLPLQVCSFLIQFRFLTSDGKDEEKEHRPRPLYIIDHFVQSKGMYLAMTSTQE